MRKYKKILNYSRSSFSEKALTIVNHPEEPFTGLLYIENNKLIKKPIDPFAPIHLYQYKNKYIMDSAHELVVGNTLVTQVGICDSNTDKFLKEVKITGIVKDIVGNESKVYISSFYPPSKSSGKSNIYELDLNTNTVRPLLKNDEKQVPLQIAYHNGFLYGIYKKEKNGPLDKLQSIWSRSIFQSGK